MGTQVMTRKVARGTQSQPAFYGRVGSLRGDLLTLLHPPYTVWHLSYVIYGAALAREFNWLRLVGTLVAFFFGTGVAAHALDEWHGRPLRTRLSDPALLALGACGIVGASLVTTLGVFLLSPWVVAWAVAGVVLMMGYTLEWHRLLHSDLGFALAWGGFPVVVGYWAQTERLAVAPLLVAIAATLLSLVQRALSTPARYVRRNVSGAIVVFEGGDRSEDWPRERLLATWELPLKILASAVVALGAGLVAMRA